MDGCPGAASGEISSEFLIPMPLFFGTIYKNATFHCMHTRVFAALCARLFLYLIFVTGLSCLKKENSHNLFALLSEDASSSFLFTHPEPRASVEQKAAPRNRIVRELDEAHSRIDFWCYEFDEAEILQAFIRAKGRGVRIRITGSPDQEYASLKENMLEPEIRAHAGIQHAKLILIDDTTLIAGTGNFTESDLFHNNNVFFFFRISKLKAGEILYALTHEQSDAPVVSGLPFNATMLVSPSKGRLIQSRLVQSVLRANLSIRYLIFSHSDPVLTAALALKARSGTIVEGIYDIENGLGSGSEGERLNEVLGISPSAVFADGNRSAFEQDGALHGGHLHHKTMIIDFDHVLTGSFNYSLNARDTNMEVFFEFRDPVVANLFEMEFEGLRENAQVLARPPATTVSSHITATGDSYCAEDGSIHSLVVFYGSGADFGADYFADSERCARFDSRKSASAGIASGKRYIVSPTELSYSHDLTQSQWTPNRRLPSPSASVDLYRMSDRWIWTNESAHFDELILWSPSGLLRRPVQTITPYFHVFDPVASSDAIVFLRTGALFVAGCLQSGETLSGPPADYLDAMNFDVGHRPRCAILE